MIDVGGHELHAVEGSCSPEMKPISKSATTIPLGLAEAIAGWMNALHWPRSVFFSSTELAVGQKITTSFSQRLGLR